MGAESLYEHRDEPRGKGSQKKENDWYQLICSSKVLLNSPFPKRSLYTFYNLVLIIPTTHAHNSHAKKVLETNFAHLTHYNKNLVDLNDKHNTFCSNLNKNCHLFMLNQAKIEV